MRASMLTVGLLACMTTLVTAWSKEDQEIFRLRDEVELSEGLGTTFYDFLEIKPSASQDEINKAYRLKSRTLHPDKVKKQFASEKSKTKDKKKGGTASKSHSNAEIKSAAKAASDRFARLGIVTEILRGSGRERYDHFLNNGFPKWRGTGYYYARFRPGLGSVLIGLFIFVGGGGHYLLLLTSWKRDQEFIQRQISYGRRMAWGDAGIPGLDSLTSGSGTATPVPAADESDAQMQQQIPRNRRERRMADKMEAKDTKKDIKKPKAAKVAKASPVATPPSGAAGPKRKVVAQNGRILVVDTVGNVYMEQKDEDGEIHELLLNPTDFPRPTFQSTALYRLPSWVAATLVSRFTSSPTSDSDEVSYEKGEESSEEMEEEGATEGTDEDFEVIKKDSPKTSAVNGKGSKKGKKGRK